MRLFAVLVVLLNSSLAFASADGFAKILCESDPRVVCSRAAFDRSFVRWKDSFEKKEDVKLVQTLNRRNTVIWKTHTVALPKDYSLPLLSYLPFEFPIAVFPTGKKEVIVNLNILAWAAYDKNGVVVSWGAANGGMKKCIEDGRLDCYTPTGRFPIIDKAGPEKRSNKYPIECEDKDKCGHPMPHFMKFTRKGVGLHGNKYLTGKNSSHGCVRLFPEDALWINKVFSDKETEVVVEDYEVVPKKRGAKMGLVSKESQDTNILFSVDWHIHRRFSDKHNLSLKKEACVNNFPTRNTLRYSPNVEKLKMETSCQSSPFLNVVIKNEHLKPEDDALLFPSKELVWVLPPTTTIIDLLMMLHAFPSRGQARKNWSGPAEIPVGWSEFHVGKHKRHLCIWNPGPFEDDYYEEIYSY